MQASKNGSISRQALRCLLLSPLMLAGMAQAQMYSWKDAKGVTHFSDQPPPDSRAGKSAVTARPLAPSSSQPALPYGLNEVVKRNPVLLYTTASCSACDEGRALLQQRGIPYTEKTVNSNEDQDALLAAGSDGRVPMLMVGASKRIGFEAIAWNEALSEANYPLQSRLPAGWRQSAPLAASASSKHPLARDLAAAKAEPVAPPTETPRKPPPANAPPGFQF